MVEVMGASGPNWLVSGGGRGGGGRRRRKGGGGGGGALSACWRLREEDEPVEEREKKGEGCIWGVGSISNGHIG
jgi:hypothetical protein